MASRLTFRDKVDVCWQKQLRDRYLEEGTPPVPHLSVKRARVRPVSRKLAEQIILKYEWLGTMANTGYHYGIFFGDFCGGVCCFSKSAVGNRNAHKPFMVGISELAVLARGACVHWSPNGANSKLVSWSTRLFSDDTDCKVIIAYSDSEAGEIGTIYQACNWTYIGVTTPNKQWIAPNGRIYHYKYPASLQASRGGTLAQWTKRIRDEGWEEQACNPKHRYVYILDKSDTALVERVEEMRQPYPKRAGVV